MADNEDDSGSTRTITVPAQCVQPGESGSQTLLGAESGQPGDGLPAGSGAQLADFLQSCQEQKSLLVGSEFTGTDLVNTTILYVQPDGSLVEGSGLTAEEQQALLDQLTKQQIVQVSDSEAVQLLQQSQLLKTIPVHNAALDPSQLQQVINQNNASQQLKSVAQQVAMQTGSSVQVVQKKSEPVRIQIQAPPKQEVKLGSAPQQKSIAVSHPQVKLSANGSVSSAQIIHIQPVVGQQGQQFFLQQRPGDPPIQLLLQSPAPVVSSLLPLVHKVQTPSTVKTALPSAVKTPPTLATKTISIPPVKSPTNGTASTKMKKREKKAPKVQTRSGRVSRPPKYKAKDYKFIKTEDLADSHQSDSDDYSDMSVEEEGEDGRKDGPASSSSPSLTYSHKSRSHRCQTCDKAYIGSGGLNRHYKLNPTHGEPDPPGDPPSNTPRPLRDDSQSKETRAGGFLSVCPQVEGGPAAAVGLRGLHHRGPGRPRGRGRGRGRGRRGRRGRPPKLAVPTVTAEQQVERRRDRLQEVVEQCEDEELMDIVLPRLTKVLSLWELLLAKVERGGPARTRFPDIYREFESLQAQVRQAAQDYIISPQGGAMPLEVRNIEVRSSTDSVAAKHLIQVRSDSVRNSVSQNSKMLPPSKRFKMENSIPVHQNGLETPRTGTHCYYTLLLHTATTQLHTTPSTQTLPPVTLMEVTAGEDPGEEPLPAAQNQVLSTNDITAQMKELEEALGSGPETAADSKTPESSSVQTPSQLQQRGSSQSESSSTDPCEPKELQEGQEIYIQTEGLTVQLAEPGLDRIVIVNGPDGTTMHIQTPEGVPLEAVQALLGIERPAGGADT
uniref:C2H2-type domain-containing protein n=1 Tax=Dicentrarchus labrax TaxID=13489 RepID=A0A8P4G9P7_DICLA